MKKDVIYIDIEDDITSIIGKLKAAENKIVALVPPKRTGVLQSIVNLKLLKRAADNADKRVVLITGDHSLGALAAGLSIPVARNLNSKPELATVDQAAAASAVAGQGDADEDDVINGEDLPIGDFAASSGVPTEPTSKRTGSYIPDGAAAAAAADLDGKDGTKTAAKAGLAGAAAKKANHGMKVPNFDTFRKKLFLIGGAAALLIVFLVWAIFFAPRATVTIAANASTENIQQQLTFDASKETNTGDGLFKPVIRTIKKQQSADFTATGTKTIGDKAKGSMSLSNGFDNDPVEVPAGTTFTSDGGQVFTSDAAVTVPGAGVRGGRIVPGTASVSVSASAIGPEYNLSEQSYDPGVDGIAATGSAMSGGSKQDVKVVAQGDVDKALDTLAKDDQSAIKKELQAQFNGSQQIIIESFSAAGGNPSASPAVGAQGDGGKVSVETTYTMLAVERSDLTKLLDGILKERITDEASQRIYDNGADDIRFSQFQTSNNISTARLNTVGAIGPNINTDGLASELSGKNYGEIESITNDIEGVQDTTVNFSPFWVTRAPAADKIDIKFSVSSGTSDAQQD